MQHILVTSIDQVDFDGLYAASLPYLDRGNMKWPKGADAAARKEFFRQHLLHAMANPIGFGTLLIDDDQQYALTYGLNNRGTFHVNTGLFKPLNGSRSYLFTQDLWTGFLRSHDIHTLVFTMPIGSSLATLLQERYPNCRRPQIVDGWWHQSVRISQEPK